MLISTSYFFITAFLGLLRDYSKNRPLMFSKFMRSPLITWYIYCYNGHILKSIIFERWIMLLAKSFYSFYKGDFTRLRRDKYLNLSKYSLM